MRSIIALCTLLGGITAWAQQDPQFSHNQFNHQSTNPATVGLKENTICGSLIYRNQWTGFQGAPRTFVLNVHGNIQELQGGWGLSALADRLGQEMNFSMKVKYSRQFSLSGGTLSAGIAAGVNQKSLGTKWVTTGVPPSQDPGINTTQLSGAKADADLGLHYTRGDMFVGISSTNILQSSPLPNFKTQRHYYVTGGYTFKHICTAFDLSPSVFIKSDGVVTQVDINALFEFQSALYAGITYRVEDAIVPIVGIQKPIPAGHFRCGVAYGITTSGLAKVQWGTPEVFASLCIPIEDNRLKYPDVKRLGKRAEPYLPYEGYPAQPEKEEE